MRFFQTNITSTTLTEDDTTTSHVVIDALDDENSKYQLIVTDYLPYIYVEVKNTPLEIVNFLEARNVTVEKYTQSEKMNIFGYQETNLKLVKCFFSSVTHLNSAKKALENSYTVYNRNIPFMVQFMVDLGLKGMTYIDVKKTSDTFEKKQKDTKAGVNFSSAASETDKEDSDGKNSEISSPLAGTPIGLKKYISFKNISTVDDKSLPSFKVLSFDIETKNRENKFPDAAFDPIIQIGNTIKIEDTKIQIIFCVGETASIDNAEVRWFKTEKEMLQAWFKYIFILDYDIIIGYNINFSIFHM
uniref:DNA polymerase delta catalytic subunit-like n=1 Tax=Doryrhamphus excisus TaxID=161450 RepID=UPI0025ADD764|nr:DNA polymerase delta catalytic subunit-like [Doryrhamphus excisus]